MTERESMDFDVVIVGAGVAGLSAAIRLKQLNAECNVVVVEKGSEVGAHILSGAVIDPIGLDKLLPEWRKDKDHPLKTPVKDDRFYFMGHSGSIRLPNFLMPPLMNNHGNYIASLGQVTRWLATKAEGLGVEIYPGFAANEVLYENDVVVGIATGDMGIGKDGKHTSGYTRGMELRGKYVLFAEGVRGQLSKQVIAKYALDKDCEPQKFGIGLKELWQVRPEMHEEGLVQHSFGYPLKADTGGGSFLYHLEGGLVAVGFVVHLNYTNPTLSPFDEFQKFKMHPSIRPIFEGGKRLSYGARAITEGGYQSVPKLTFNGGALIGCAAGFVNVPRIKGSHNAVLSGIMAANELDLALKAGRSGDELAGYDAAWRDSEIGIDLKRVRNVKPLWSKFGTFLGIGLGALDMWVNTIFGNSPLNMKHGKRDCDTLKLLSEVKVIEYPKPDGIVSFDKLSSVFMSSTNHEENQPSHLTLRDASIPIAQNLPKYGEPARLYCPAGVYEVVENKFVINAQNCVHCKTCDIKDPAQNITWVAPEGGGGPNYERM